MANRKLILEYPAGVPEHNPATGKKRGTHREVMVPRKLYRMANGLKLPNRIGDIVATNMWQSHVTGNGIDAWPPTLDEFQAVMGLGSQPERETSGSTTPDTATNVEE